MENQNQDGPNIDTEITFKVVVVGNAGVGKSCLIQFYTTKKFQENYQMTIGMDFVKQKVIIDEDNSMNTAGQEVFKSIVRSFYSGSTGVILVYNTTDSRSFDALTEWISEIKESVSEFCIKVLIGSQSDRTEERKISKEQGENFAKAHNFHFFFETSAKTGANVDDAFDQIAKKIYTTQMRKFQGMSTQSDRKVKSNFQPKPERISLNNEHHQYQIEQQQKKKSGCC